MIQVESQIRLYPCGGIRQRSRSRPCRMRIEEQGVVGSRSDVFIDVVDCVYQVDPFADVIACRVPAARRGSSGMVKKLGWFEPPSCRNGGSIRISEVRLLPGEFRCMTIVLHAGNTGIASVTVMFMLRRFAPVDCSQTFGEYRLPLSSKMLRPPCLCWRIFLVRAAESADRWSSMPLAKLRVRRFSLRKIRFRIISITGFACLRQLRHRQVCTRRVSA